MCGRKYFILWGNEDTEELIRILGEYDVPATFFVVGEWVDKYPESVKALSDAGHDVMNHSDTHPDLTKCGRDGVVKEIEGCNKKIEEVTGVRPTLHRCPYGAYDNTVIETVRSLDMEPVQWDVDGLERVLVRRKQGKKVPILLFVKEGKRLREEPLFCAVGVYERKWLTCVK